VVASVLTEALLLALAGAVVGGSIAWLLFNGNTVTLGDSTGSIVFDMRITPALLLLGVLIACSVGFIGGLLPAVRAARLPVATALRAV
jgi:putative ABC transport system permease protein